MNALEQQQAIYKVGVVSAIDPATAKARVRFADLDGLESAFLPVGQRKSLRDRDYWMPDVGEHVACLMDANAEDGVIVCAIYSDAEPPPVSDPNKRHVRFDDGCEMEYDRATHTLRIVGGIEKVLVEVGEEIILRAGTRVRVEAGQDITLQAGVKVLVDAPDSEFTGNVLVQGLLTYMLGMIGYGAAGGAAAVVRGPVRIEQGDLEVQQDVAIEGNMRTDGSVDVGQNIDAGGNITAQGTVTGSNIGSGA